MASIESVTIDQKQSVHAETRKLGTNQYVQRQNQSIQVNNQPGRQQQPNQGQPGSQKAQMNPNQAGAPGQLQFGNNQQWSQQNGSINLHVLDNQPKSVTMTKQSIHAEMRLVGFKTSTKRPLTQTPFVRRIRTALDNME